MSNKTLFSLVDNDRLQRIEKSLDTILKHLAEAPRANHTMNAKQAAAFIKVSMPTLYEKTSKNKIPYLKNGGGLIFSKSELEVWLRAGRPDLMDKAIENLISKNH